jgi:hypothetical protein
VLEEREKRKEEALGNVDQDEMTRIEENIMRVKGYLTTLKEKENWTDEQYYEEIVSMEDEEMISENGDILSTYNPDSKWDWYDIGGRWNGFLPLKEKDDNGNPICTNMARVDEIDWNYLFENKYVPFCFVTEGGCWEEKGEMGWWGITINEQPEDVWDIKFKNYIRTLDPDCEVTVIDFHI